MAKMTVDSGVRLPPALESGTLMIHNDLPPMVVIVDEVLEDGLSFFGTSLDTGYRIEYDASQFTPFIGKLTLEQ